MAGRDQHRHGGAHLGQVQRGLGQAEQEVGAGRAAAAQLVGIAGIDADPKPRGLQGPHRLLEMRERACRGRQPRSITSAPWLRSVSARAQDPATSSADASTISAKIRVSWATGRAARPATEELPADP